MTHRFLKLFCTLLFAVWASASSAMFISPDPLDPTTPGVGTNRYAYSGGDPINRADPSGHAWVDRTWDNAFGEGSFDRTFGDGASERMDRVADSLFGDSHDRGAAGAYGDYSRGGGSLGYNAWRDATQNYTVSFARDYLAGGAEVGAFTPRSGPGAKTRTFHVGGFLDNILPNSPVKGMNYRPYYTWGNKGRLARDVFACAGSSGCNARVAGHSMGGHTVGIVVGAMPPGSATGLMVDPVPVFARSPIPGSPNLKRIYAVPSNRNFSDFVADLGASSAVRSHVYSNIDSVPANGANHYAYSRMLSDAGW